MSTARVTVEIKESDLSFFEIFLKKIKAKKIKVEKIQDDTKMSKKEFYQMIEEASKSPKRKISKDELQKMLLG
ncbi:hypothetical protein [Capnocytophaga sp.]|uniref:hypothetical protein n=1 Tax=Capnocytophaga sp. TaxID=44737 RepID=UPI0026DBA411|nr:hypothetical protein [Capnocytophaga sp.]MDO5105605.1 hypothetical protein [Capnocytophaga sp.]